MRQRRLYGAELDAYLTLITDALVRSLAPTRIILFGSFARGDQNRASDLDLVIIADSGLPFCERIGRALEVCYAVSTRLPVEALVYTAAEWELMLDEGNSFAARVLHEGRVLYERKPQSQRSGTLAETSAA